MALAYKMDDHLAHIAMSSEDLRAANINPKTHLATDYLNHFNEVLMMMEILPSMPDMIGDVMSWQPKDYPSHFRDTNFTGKDLAIAAFECAPTTVRTPFEQTIAMVDKLIIEAQRKLAEMDLSNEERAEFAVSEALELIRPMLGEADRIIHGREETIEAEDMSDAQADIDSLFDMAEMDLSQQNIIDDLFDHAPMLVTNSMHNSAIEIMPNRLRRNRKFLRSRMKYRI